MGETVPLSFTLQDFTPGPCKSRLGGTAGLCRLSGRNPPLGNAVFPYSSGRQTQRSFVSIVFMYLSQVGQLKRAP